MKNIFDPRTVIIVLLLAVIFWLNIPYIKKQFNISEISKDITSTSNKDAGFYKYLNAYISILPEDKYKIVRDRINKISQETENENSDIQNALILVMANEIISDPVTEKILTQLKKDVADLIIKSKIDQDILFSKNTECAKLTSNIKDGLSKKYKNDTNTKEEEELNFIFYSPSINACLFTTKYTYTYSNYSSGKSEYYSKNSSRIYNISSSNELGDYPSYYYKYPGISEEETRTAIEEGQRNYTKFVFENSGYNAKLLKDVSY